MHNAAFQALRLDYRYLPFAVRPAALKDAVSGLRALGIVGANLTIPHKERAIPYLDELSREARLIGAVNTIVRRGERLIGHNTDAGGFLRAFREDTGGHFLVLGAGGAARAVVVALAMAGARSIAVVNRSAGRALDLIRRGRRAFPGVEWSAPTVRALPSAREVRAVIQCTSVGLHPGDPSPLPREWLEPWLIVYDLVYNIPTALLRDAKRVGARHAGGLGMLLHQGALAFTLWTARKAPIAVMRRAAVYHGLSQLVRRIH
jgi:shikimate dehydrogenase